ncbi:DNA polymerase III subunit gamma and tau [Agilicoccus flavus]|uniref:DNA polymerase III subunit gamma and tau n=1 Tax=Agilicoccus flavus TaxID=2775968 RepID=UPI001CF715D8|nr:DNA polymerase III subunit gamma and tau [Agilicoccus flavus]
MSTALYRRYRPQTFADVIGQEHVTEPLQQALRAGRIGHAYLFSGPRGCGKTTSARILARCLNCEQGPTPTPCGTCDSCVALARGGPGSVDVIEIDAASHGGVDDARDLREKASYGPAQSRFKVYIIDEAHMVTPQGFNALLKIVEEPPEHVKFVFATTEPEKVIGTIRSRTHHYPFRLVPPARLQSYLEELCELEGVAVEPGVLSFVIRAGGGSVRDSLSVLDQLMAGSGEDGLTYAGAAALLGFTEAELLDATIDAVAAQDGASVFRQIDRVIETGQDPRRFVEDLLERLRDLIIVSAVNASGGEGLQALFRGLPSDQLDRMSQQAAAFGPGELSHAADVVNAGLTEMTGATSPRLQLELICARVLLPTSAGEAGYAARIDRIEKRLDMAGPQPPAAPVRRGRAAAPASGESTSRVPDERPAEVSGDPAGDGWPAEQGEAPGGPRPGSAASAGRTDGPADRAAAGSADDAAPAARRPASSAEGRDPADASGRGSDGTASPGVARRGSSAGEPSRDRTSGAPVDPTSGRAVGAPDPEPGRQAPAAGGPTSPGSAPSAAQPARGGLDTDALRRAWPDVLAKVFAIRRVTWTFLSEHAQVLDYDGDRLLIGIATAGLAQTFRNGHHGEVVRQALIEARGVDTRVEGVPLDEARSAAGRTVDPGGPGAGGGPAGSGPGRPGGPGAPGGPRAGGSGGPGGAGGPGGSRGQARAEAPTRPDAQAGPGDAGRPTGAGPPDGDDSSDRATAPAAERERPAHRAEGGRPGRRGETASGPDRGRGATDWQARFAARTCGEGGAARGDDVGGGASMDPSSPAWQGLRASADASRHNDDARGWTGGGGPPDWATTGPADRDADGVGARGQDEGTPAGEAGEARRGPGAFDPGSETSPSDEAAEADRSVRAGTAQDVEDDTAAGGGATAPAADDAAAGGSGSLPEALDEPPGDGPTTAPVGTLTGRGPVDDGSGPDGWGDEPPPDDAPPPPEDDGFRSRRPASSAAAPAGRGASSRPAAAGAATTSAAATTGAAATTTSTTSTTRAARDGAEDRVADERPAVAPERPGPGAPAPRSSAGADRPRPASSPGSASGTGRRGIEAFREARRAARTQATGEAPTAPRADDDAAAFDDENIDDLAAVGQPVIASVLGGTVITDLES